MEALSAWASIPVSLGGRSVPDKGLSLWTCGGRHGCVSGHQGVYGGVEHRIGHLHGQPAQAHLLVS